MKQWIRDHAIVLTLLLVLSLMILIFSFSAQPAEESDDTSGFFVTLILKILVSAVPAILTTSFGHTIFMMFYYVIIINVSLMLFNLLPVPPLDGFNVFTEIFHLEKTQFHHFVYRNSMVILLVLIILDVPHMLLTRPLYAIVNFITTTIFHIF